MARPRNCRRVDSIPQGDYFKPRGIRLSMLEGVVLTIDKSNAIRLADLESLCQEQAAEMVNASRQTIRRIVESARGKVAEMLVKGKALRSEGGEFEIAPVDCEWNRSRSHQQAKHHGCENLCRQRPNR